MNGDTVRCCECHLLEVLGERADFPIRYCARTKTFEMVHSDGSGRMRLTYCFSCGGILPEEDHSWRSKLDEIEQAQAEAVMAQARSTEEVVSILGPPDEIMPWIDTPVGGVYEALADRIPRQYASQSQWIRCLRYSKRWPSLLLDIYEYEDGRIEHTIWEQNFPLHDRRE